MKRAAPYLIVCATWTLACIITASLNFWWAVALGPLIVALIGIILYHCFSPRRAK